MERDERGKSAWPITEIIGVAGVLICAECLAVPRDVNRVRP